MYKMNLTGNGNMLSISTGALGDPGGSNCGASKAMVNMLDDNTARGAAIGTN
jgi:hypothetical protein